jgi:hypothetical protein
MKEMIPSWDIDIKHPGNANFFQKVQRMTDASLELVPAEAEIMPV